MKLIFNFDGELINEFPKKIQERYLEYFSVSDCLMVRELVANHSNTPPHILEKLSGDEDWWVRDNVAKHPNTPVHTLEKLSDDFVKVIRNNAKENLKKKKILTNLWSNVKSS